MRDDKQLITCVRNLLLPAPPPFIQWLERVLRLLPSRFYPVTLLPVADVKPVNAVNGDYHATGNHPVFQIVDESHLSDAGWYLLEAVVVRHGGNRIAKLHVGDDMEDDGIFIPSNRRGSISEVIYLPHGLDKVRWSPMETSGRFTQSALIFHRITSVESFFRRAWRVWDDWWRLRLRSAAGRDGVSWYSPFVALNRAYAWSAGLRRAHSIALTYPAFIQRSDLLSDEDVTAIVRHIPQLALQPVFCILMRVCKPVPDFFRAALDSVLAQLYPHWLLYLVVDAAADESVRAMMDDCIGKDPRIRLCAEFSNPFAISNGVPASTAGEFMMLMQAEDLLPAHALYHMAVEINRHPDVRIIYPDEDKIDALGQRFEPCFKPDWNFDWFYAQGWFSSVAAYHAALIRQTGGFRDTFGSIERQDLALRCVGQIETDAQIRHIPRVLYHRRAHEKHTLPDDERCAALAGEKAINAHFNHQGISARAEFVQHGYRIRHTLPDVLPLVSLIIPTRDQVDVLKKCIASLQTKTDYPDFEVLVMDNQSSDPAALEYLATLPQDQRFRVIRYDAPFNYSAINNYAVTLARGEIIGLVNNDIEAMHADWLHEMVSHVLRPDVGAVGAKLLYSDGTVQHAGVILGLGGLAGHAHKYFEGDDSGYFGRANLTQTFSAVTAACLLVRKSIYEQVGGLDEQNLTVAYNDVDF